MSDSITFLRLGELVIERVRKPLSNQEIWEEATRLGLSKLVPTRGETPWDSIGAQIYVDIRDNPKSAFYQASKRPTKFFLKRFQDLLIDAGEEKTKEKTKFAERDLHPIVCFFINRHQHFKAYIKTIYHESSSNSKKDRNQWLHPDLVGAYFPFDDYNPVTLRVQKSLSMSSVRLFSFEVKKELSFSNLRQSFFQAVSNSSWANEGYLVVGKVAEDPDLIDELRRLNNAFGIGLIKLNLENVDQSEILLQSRTRTEFDWNTVNRLIEENPNYKQFMEDVEEDLRLGKIKGKYDDVLSQEKMNDYLKEKILS